MTFDDFMQAVNDGRDRVERGWGVRIQWLINIPRNEPRRADEALRWAGSVGGKKSGIAGIVLSGKEDLQPSGQFERAFVNAQKKDVGTAVFAGDVSRAEGVQVAVDVLKPDRLLDGWGAWNSPELVDKLVNDAIPVDLALSRALKLGWVNSYEEISLRQIYDENIKLTLSSDMPSIYQTSLTDEYMIALEKSGLSVDELEEIALNAITYSFLSDAHKAQMREEFQQEYQRLRGEHLTQETAEG
jgi:adenosine deaminase